MAIKRYQFASNNLEKHPNEDMQETYLKQLDNPMYGWTIVFIDIDMDTYKVSVTTSSETVNALPCNEIAYSFSQILSDLLKNPTQI